MDFSTLCCKKPRWLEWVVCLRPDDWPGLWAVCRLCGGWALLWATLLLGATSGRLYAAEAAPPAWPVTVQHSADGVLLSARAPFTLTPALEEALHKGVPLHFVWDSTLLRRRWYWRDKVVLRAARTVRLAYQPLTRRWRVSVTDGLPNGAAASALHQNFDSLAHAWPSVSRVAGWKLADAARLVPDDDYQVQVGFRLEVAALPGPLQIGLLPTQDWGLALSQTLLLPPLGGTSELGQPARDATVQTLNADTTSNPAPTGRSAP